MRDNTSILDIKGVGEKTARLFAKLGISNCKDLIRFHPRDYVRFSKPVPVKNLKPGDVEAVHVKILSFPKEKKVRNLSILNFTCADNTGTLYVTFFNMPYLKSTLKAGGYYILRGSVQRKGADTLMEQPKVYAYDEYMSKVGQLQPKYPLTKGLTNQTITKVLKQVLTQYLFEEEYYPNDFLEQYQLMSYKEAIHKIHFPTDGEELRNARKRLVFDEFFTFLYYMQKNKALSNTLQNKYLFFETADTVRFLEQLPFPLTKAQKKVWQEIKDDFSRESCMNRLIQGDVGSGKTILAILALLLTASNGYQGAFMVPTEVLAMQHFETIQEYIRKYNLCFKPVLLVGSMSQKEKKEAYTKISSGEANVIIGTHALIQEKVNYKCLALVVTDEQHRFGVRQREQFADKGNTPHILVMSATPIPRTLALILYGDLDISVIDELPANRLPIKNCVVNQDYRPNAYRFITSQVEKGRQVYVICSQVEEGEIEGLENVVEYTEKLRSQLPGNIQISYLHGKMRPADKNRIMDEFSAGKIDVLVSTTVIEVGINVPNATVMLIENAERFGLAQLHQLRGRVGRGSEQSYCIFISGNENPEIMNRLQILEHSNDGFHIASEDLKLRGPGDLFGVRQSGEFAFQVADIYTDANVLKQASDAVNQVIQSEENQDKYSLLFRHLEKEYSEFVDFRTI